MKNIILLWPIVFDHTKLHFRFWSSAAWLFAISAFTVASSHTTCKTSCEHLNDVRPIY